MNLRQLGRAFVKKCILRFRELDNATYEVAGSGAGLDKGDLRVPRFDLVCEAKDHSRINLSAWVRQAERQGLNSSKTALLWRMPDSPRANPDIRVDISIDYFLELLQRSGDPLIKKEDREFGWKLKRLKQSAHEVLKELGE